MIIDAFVFSNRFIYCGKRSHNFINSCCWDSENGEVAIVPNYAMGPEYTYNKIGKKTRTKFSGGRGGKDLDESDTGMRFMGSTQKKGHHLVKKIGMLYIKTMPCLNRNV